jgi:glycosyltransferase involved in cell wall biosynthesis
MKILLVHNYYQLSGGEDEVFRREKQLLAGAGHQVLEYTRHNEEINRYKLVKMASLALSTTWAWDSYRDLRVLLEEEKPDIAHFHNTFPLISPSAYYACAAAGVPVVQTLHNPRLICPAGTLYRDGQPCDDCVHGLAPWAAVRHACYQGSHVRSALAASMLVVHRCLGTWESKIDRYVVSTNFYRNKFTEAGIAPEKLALKPHFVEADPGIQEKLGEYALFVGRLAPEKGVSTLLAAWQGLGNIPLKIRGEGPLAAMVQDAADASDGRVTVVPRLSREDLMDLIKGARFLVWPSEGYYETFGLIAIEAFASGVPVIASRTGVMQEIVEHSNTGLHFRPGDPSDLSEKVNWAWSHPEELQEMGRTARAEFESKYTRERNYIALREIYQQVLEERLSARTVLAHAVAE